MGSGSSKEPARSRDAAGDDQYYQGRLFAADRNSSYDKDSYSGRLSPYDRSPSPYDNDSIRE